MIETANLLTEVLSQALETMAFMDVMPDEEDLPTPDNTILAEINFTGPKHGTLEILAGLDLAKIFAENIGALDDADDEDAFDAIRELSNVTCGLLLPMIAAELSDVFDMTVPTVKSGNETPQWSEFVSDSCVLNVEDHLVAIKLSMKDEES